MMKKIEEGKDEIREEEQESLLFEGTNELILSN